MEAFEASVNNAIVDLKFPNMSEVTHILLEMESGSPTTSSRLFAIVYEELRSIAKARMRHERKDHTLQTTALVHEAYVRLVDQTAVQQWRSRGHFFAAAAEAMRRICVEHARRKLGKKRGGDLQKVELIDEFEMDVPNPEILLAISEAMDKLEQRDHQAAELVKLHCFAGFSIPEAAKLLGIATSSAYAHWAFAKALMGKLLS